MIARVQIDDAIWDAADRVRRHDWRVSIADLIDEARLGGEADHLLHLATDARALHLSTFDEGGVPQSVAELPLDLLRAPVDEYLAVIRKMEEAKDADASPTGMSSRMLALDMAKKVVHDAGAKTIARALPDLVRDHESSRRLFSLVLSLLVDVTALPGARGHIRK